MGREWRKMNNSIKTIKNLKEQIKKGVTILIYVCISGGHLKFLSLHNYSIRTAHLEDIPFLVSLSYAPESCLSNFYRRCSLERYWSCVQLSGTAQGPWLDPQLMCV